MKIQLHPLSAVLVAVVCQALGAQSDIPSPDRADWLPSWRTPLLAQVDPATGDQELWVAARDYKASFHDGFRLHVAPQGAAAPARTFAFRTTAVQVAGERRPLRAVHARIASPDRCEYDLGPVLEAYDLRDDGVEQTFVLRQAPGGDLEITGTITTDLWSEPMQGHGAVELRAPGGGGLRYGAVTVVDGNGASLPIQTDWRGDHVVLRVPGDWLASAKYPVVIDPLLSPLTVQGTTGADDRVTHVAIDRDDRSGSRNLGIGIERTFAQGDTDVYFVLADDGFTNPVVVFSRVTNAPAGAPDLAYVHASNRWVMVWQAGVDGSETCLYHLHQGGDASVGSQLTQFTSQAGGRQRKPKVSGSRRSFSTSTTALLVREWEPAGTTGDTAGTQIWASRLNVASGQEQAPFWVGGTNMIDVGRPAVNKDSGDGSFVVAYQYWSGLVVQRWQVAVRRIGQDGTLSGSVLYTDRTNFQEHLLSPQVDGRDGRFVLGFGTTSSVGNPGKIADIDASTLRAMRFDWADNQGQGVVIGYSDSLVQGASAGYRVDSIGHDSDTRSHWAVTYRSNVSNSVFLRVLGYRGIARWSETVSTNGARSSAVVYDDDNDRFAIAYGQAIGTNEDRVRGVRFDYPAQNLPSIYGSGCGQGYMSWFNGFRIGSEFPTVRLIGAPPSGFALLLMSARDADIALAPFGLPGCRLLVDPSNGVYVGALGMTINGGGAAGLTIPLPESLGNADVFFQWAYVDPNAASGFVTSQGLKVEVR